MKVFLSIILTIIMFSCNEDKTEANEKTHIANKSVKLLPKNQSNTSNNKINFDPKKDLDKNKDKVTNHKDWILFSKEHKYKVVEYYTNLTYQSLGISPSIEVKEKEINMMLNKINSYYKNSRLSAEEKNIDIYELMLSVK